MAVRMLIVEDHDLVRRSLVDWLGALFPQLEILEASDGEQAVDLASSHGPALVLMDIGLPGLDGLEATRRIKRLLPDTRVVMLTIHEDDAYRADALASGASAYISKRTMQAQLLDTLSGLLPRCEAGRNLPLSSSGAS
ncbi:MAG: response regulator transcription factor [Anaerolineae bacterium]